MNILKLNKRNRAYRSTFCGTDEANLVLADILEFCGQYKPTYVQSDPYATAFNEGKRRVALRVLKLLSLKESDMQKIVDVAKGNTEAKTNNDPFGLYN